MRLSTILVLGAFALSAGEADAAELTPECRAKLTEQVTSLEASFTENRSQFDSHVDQLLTKYAASHPAASKADYKAIFDETFQQRFSKLFTHRDVLVSYKGALDGTADAGEMCRMSDRKMRKEREKVIARDKSLHDQILGDMARMFP